MNESGYVEAGGDASSHLNINKSGPIKSFATFLDFFLLGSAEKT